MTLIYSGNLKTKKALKEQGIGKYLSFSDPSIFGQKDHPLNGDAIVLDHPKRSKFAQVWTTSEGILQKVA
jgi:hypothetical protein